MTKTIKQWLETLPEPYRGQALANLKNPEQIDNSLNGALKGAFVWETSAEGHAYWEEVAKGKYPVILSELAPTCAIHALMAIALKKGFDVQDIESIVFQRGYEGQHIWRYRLKDTDYFDIDLKP
jgi:hypothetical protein